MEEELNDILEKLKRMPIEDYISLQIGVQSGEIDEISYLGSKVFVEPVREEMARRMRERLDHWVLMHMNSQPLFVDRNPHKFDFYQERIDNMEDYFSRKGWDDEDLVPNPGE